jgi:outer membrane protein assembly factor BamB
MLALSSGEASESTLSLRRAMTFWRIRFGAGSSIVRCGERLEEPPTIIEKRAMTFLPIRLSALIFFLSACAGSIARADDWPMYGRDASRNSVAPGEKGLIADADPSAARNLKWNVALGSAAYGNATVAGGRIFLGTNNSTPRNPKYAGDRGVLLCLDEKTGKFIWQLVVPKLRAGKASDYDDVGLCSAPTVEGDRVYAVTNRCEVICLTTKGLSAGNTGPFVDEAQYTAGENQPPIKQGDDDADIVWRFDMRDRLGVFPHNMTSSSVLVVGDKVFVTTSNGVDWTGKHLPSPDAPALICLDKKTGKLLARERSGISGRTYYCNWSSPASGVVNGKPMVIFGGGDGYCYGFDPEPGATIGPDGVATIPELWRCNCNATDRLKDGKPIAHGEPGGPCEVIATPVIVDGRVYAAVGQEPESGEGQGCVNCIDASKSGDISATGVIWRNEKIGRTLSSCTMSDGLIYLPDFAGIIHCLDAKTGAEVWSHDTEAHVWGSAMVADGKVYAGNENGTLLILAAGREKKVLASIDFKDAIDSTPLVANHTVFIGTLTQLFALELKEAK